MAKDCDVVIIGAGPSGAVAAANLVRHGLDVIVLERDIFPRFVIGESLLPQSMIFLEEAGLLADVEAAGFQPKNGATFHWNGKETAFDFSDKFSPGWDKTFQVVRADFDKILADGAEKAGARIRYGCTVTDAQCAKNEVELKYDDENGTAQIISARFCLDASGYGRVLPRILSLEKPSSFPLRISFFTHIRDNIKKTEFDRNKILITVHPSQRDTWFWLIPFSNGMSSLGIVVAPDNLSGAASDENGDNEAILRRFLAEDPNLSGLLRNAEFPGPVSQIRGYSASVTSLIGPGFALLGNAGEFIDPVFSSGVTIALYSASLASSAVVQELSGQAVDWLNDFVDPLMIGVETFRSFVEAWYDQSLQDIIFYPDREPRTVTMITSILAGYAWDLKNPFVSRSRRRLAALAAACAT